MFSSKSLMVRESELGYLDHGGALAVKLQTTRKRLIEDFVYLLHNWHWKGIFGM